jgi:membrane-associated phospholipid phosphatase
VRAQKIFSAAAASVTHNSTSFSRRRRAAQPLLIAPVVVALWVSASRIHDFAHSAGDVSGGLLLGGAFGALLLARTRALDTQLRAEAASAS